MDADVLLLAASAAHAAFSLVVSVVVYPALRDAAVRDPAGWGPVHDAHSRRISRVVAPLYLLALTACGWALLDRPTALTVVAVAATAAALLATALGAAPTHGRLGRDGPRPDLLARLLRADVARTVAAVVAAGAAAAALVTG